MCRSTHQEEILECSRSIQGPCGGAGFPQLTATRGCARRLDEDDHGVGKGSDETEPLLHPLRRYEYPIADMESILIGRLLRSI